VSANFTLVGVDKGIVILKPLKNKRLRRLVQKLLSLRREMCHQWSFGGSEGWLRFNDKGEYEYAL